MGIEIKEVEINGETISLDMHINNQLIFEILVRNHKHLGVGSDLSLGLQVVEGQLLFFLGPCPVGGVIEDGPI